MKPIIFPLIIALAVAGCAGRVANPVDVVQTGDAAMTCKDISTEIAYNNSRVKRLAQERNMEIVQDSAVGVAGFFVPVLWLGLDLQGAPGVEANALKFRQRHLMDILKDKNCK
jgi:ABC-type phosphate/phosphonate transport system substrate-binding protein